MLSPEQVAHFEAFGFLHLKEFLAAELSTLLAEHAAVLERQYGDPEAPVTTRQWVRTLTDDTPAFQRLAEKRFAGIAEQLYGPDIFCAYTEANRYAGDTNWHPDCAVNYNAPGVRFAFYLDPLGADTGALRIIPGSVSAIFAA